MLLGLKNVERIVTVVTLRNEITGKLDLGRFWDLAAEIAEVSAQVAGKIKGASTDDAYTFGLFRDCGMPLMMQAYDDYRAIVAKSEKANVSPATKPEDEQYGTNHCEVGQYLCNSWYLPESICDAIYFHHHEDNFNNKNISAGAKSLLTVLMIAERICLAYRNTKDEHSDEQWAQIGEQVLSSVDLNEESFLEMQEELITGMRDNAEAP